MELVKDDRGFFVEKSYRYYKCGKKKVSGFDGSAKPPKVIFDDETGKWKFTFTTVNALGLPINISWYFICPADIFKLIFGWRNFER